MKFLLWIYSQLLLIQSLKIYVYGKICFLSARNIREHSDLFLKLIRICWERSYFNLRCFVIIILEIHSPIFIESLLPERHWDGGHGKHKMSKVKLLTSGN